MRTVDRRSFVFCALGLALVARAASAQTPPTELVFEGTVTDLEQSGIGCGYEVFAGAFRIRIDRVISGPPATGEIRVIATCSTPSVGRRYRIVATLTTRRHGRFNHGLLRHPLPADGIPTFVASRYEEIRGGT